ncbi:MAG: FkbM family methyltransferase [Flavobacteriales bacterium]|jgi:methyltransferase, FkbM family|nr:FkbM family methyltransferase [Flavobacteriales bacterium]MCA0392332.1 FkbM family methyltransferase [Bacteroidota bacterium]
MLNLSSIRTKNDLKRLYKYPHLKTLYKGSILDLKNIVNLYNNIISDGDSCELFGSIFYGLEKVNYFTLDEVFTSDFYKFESDDLDPVIIDCGANVGFSVLYFKITHPGAKIYAFEPDSKNYGFLQKNIQSYRWENDVFPYKTLVSDSDGFEFFEELGNAGSKIVEESPNATYIKKIRLLSFLNELDKDIDFLKLDIEGSEFQVVPDLKPWYPRIKRIYIEFHCENSDFQYIYDFISKHLGDHFKFQINANFTKDQNIYTSIQNVNSSTYYNCFFVNKNL